MSFTLIFLIAALGDFLGLAHIAPILNYNAMNSTVLFTAAGLLLWGLAPRQHHGKAYFLLAAGLLAGFDFFIKFSSSIAFTGLASIFILLCPAANGFKDRLRRLGWMWGGLFLGAALFFAFFKPADAWYQGFLYHFIHEAKGTHNPLWILNRQFKDLLALGQVLLICGLAQFLVLAGLHRLWLHKKPQIAAWLIAILLGANFGIAATVFRFRGFQFDSLNTLLILVTLCVAVLAFRSRLAQNRSRGMVMLLLFLLPFAIHFGSNAIYSFGLPLFLMPWFALILMLVHQLPEQRMRSMSLIVIALMTQIQFTVKYLWFPWRNVDNRLKQTELVTEAPRLAGISVAPSTHQFIRETIALSHQASMAKHPVYLAIYQMPGVVYWLEGIAPGEPWIYRSGSEQPMNCQALQAGRSLGLRKAVLLIQDSIKAPYDQCLLSEGISPETYQKVGESYNPYSKKTVQFLIPRGGNE